MKTEMGLACPETPCLPVSRENRTLSEKEYRSAEGTSVSQLKLLPRDPLLFYGLYITKKFPLPDPTKNMALGTGLHGVVLEGKRPCIIPRDVLNSDGHRKGKAWIDWKSEHANDDFLSEEDAKPITLMAESVENCQPASKLLKASIHRELPLFSTDPDTEIKIKGRLDMASDFGGQIVLSDLKTTNDTNEREFQRAVVNFQYHRQAAFYLDLYWLATGVVPEAFCFIVVRNQPPYDCCVYELDENAIDQGRLENRAALTMLKNCMDTGNWSIPAANEIRQITLPKWAYDREF